MNNPSNITELIRNAVRNASQLIPHDICFSDLILPYQANPINEASLKHLLWETFEKQLKLQELHGNIYAEVTLKNTGKIDLILKLDNHTIGFEVKQEPFGINGKDLEQICRYAKSGYLNYIYIVGFDYNPNLTETPQILHDKKKLVNEICKIDFGIILIHPYKGGRILEEAKPLKRKEKIRELKTPLEEKIKHLLWQYFRKNLYLVALEQELPNTTRYEFSITHHPRIHVRTKRLASTRIDITAIPQNHLHTLKATNFNKKEIPATDIIGIEVKSKITPNVIEQLNTYASQKDLSYLYLGIPTNAIKQATKTISKLKHIGILAVNSQGEVTIIKKAPRLTHELQLQKFIKLEYNKNTHKWKTLIYL